MNDPRYVVWIQITLLFDSVGDIGYPEHRSAEYWWQCQLPFAPNTPMILEAIHGCIVEKHVVQGVTYNALRNAFLCYTAPHCCATMDEFELKDTFLRKACTRKPR